MIIYLVIYNNMRVWMCVCSLHFYISSNKILPTNDVESQIINQGEERKERRKETVVI